MINNLTHKIDHQGGREVIYHISFESGHWIINSASLFIHSCTTKKVIFTTIPPLDILKYNIHLTIKHKLSNPSIDQYQKSLMQSSLESNIITINDPISSINTSHCHTINFASHIIKTSIKKKGKKVRKVSSPTLMMVFIQMMNLYRYGSEPNRFSSEWSTTFWVSPFFLNEGDTPEKDTWDFKRSKQHQHQA